MEQSQVPTEDFRYAYFFFTDIVGLSDPRIRTKRQIQKIEGLTSLIASCEAFKNTDPSLMLYLPTGDGMAIGFLSGPELPVMLAVELHKKLQEYNFGKFPEEVLRIRIGIGDGPVYVVRGVSGSTNLWGPGILVTRTIMDMGDDNHILLSPQTAEVLRESDEYRQLIKPIHDYKMKDGKTILLYSVYGDGVGNPELPKKGILQRSKLKKYRQTMGDKIIHSKIEVELTVKDMDRMLTHHKQVYDTENRSNEPLESILHGIATRVKKSFSDLNTIVTDESGRECKIASINFDKPYQKEFTTSFNKPVFKGEKGRSYTLEYDIEEPKRYFEYRGIRCKKLILSLVLPSHLGFKPVILQNEKRGKWRMAEKQPEVRKIADSLFKASWTKSSVSEIEGFRFKW
jgi:hypothetical protein